MKPTALLAGAAVVALALGGCGGGSDSPTSTGSRVHAPGAAPVLRSPALFSIERRRGDVAIGETLTVGRDGSGVIVRAGGGAGRRTETCRFGSSLMATFRREAPSLPAPPTPKPRKVTNPAVYLLSRGGRHAVFMDGAIPPTVRPFVASVKGVLSGRWGACSTVRAQR
jgi:hypothetical protein